MQIFSCLNVYSEGMLYLSLDLKFVTGSCMKRMPKYCGQVTNESFNPIPFKLFFPPVSACFHSDPKCLIAHRNTHILGSLLPSGNV